MKEDHLDEISGVSTTGHEWDGIRELNNPMPRWWVYTYYATIVWAIGYTIFYPAWPLVTSATQGILGYSSRKEVKAELAAVEAERSVHTAALTNKSVSEILADDTLRQTAIQAGAAAFRVNCVQCHGSGAAGGAGYPNLNDDDWLWGGKPEQIEYTIAHGIRAAGDPDTHQSEMPAFADMLDREQIASVAAFVVSLSGKTRNPDLVEKGKTVFAENCAACHGDDARGNQEMGAPNLADAIWLKTRGEDGVIAQVKAPKHGMMPAWGVRLGDTAVKELTVFIHSLGGGQ